MPRPNTKTLLLSESRKERAALDKLLEPLTPAQMIAPGVLGDWSVKDVLAHLYEWEQMVLGWIAVTVRGETPHVPATGYKWSQIPALNDEIRQKHTARPLDEVLKMYQDSHQATMKTIELLSEETLFTRGLDPWMNKNHLAAYFTSSTSSHYRWACKEIKKGLRGK